MSLFKIPATLRTEVGHAVALFVTAFGSTLVVTIPTAGSFGVHAIVGAVVGAVVAAAHQVLAKFAPAAKK